MRIISTTATAEQQKIDYKQVAGIDCWWIAEDNRHE